MKKYVVILAAIIMQGCLGGIYAWSAFAAALSDAPYRLSSSQTQLIFGTCIFTFTVSFIWTGRWQDRFGPRPLALASGLLLGASYLLAWASGGRFELLWLGIGVVGGLGIGCGYVCPIATAIKWFPRHRGLAAGLAVAGYGAGAIVLSIVVEMLLRRGWSVLDIFGVVGVVYCLTVMLAGSLMFLPPDAAPSAATQFDRRRLARDGRFWLLFAGIFCATLPGLMIVGSLKRIGTSFGLAEATAAAAVGMFAAGNAAGRIVWGFIFDRLGARRSFLLSFSMIALSVAALALLGRLGPGLLLTAMFAGFCYGGCFGLYAPQLARMYGPHVLGTVYPLVLISHGLGALTGAMLGGASFDLTGSYLPSLAVALTLTLAGLWLFWRHAQIDD